MFTVMTIVVIALCGWFAVGTLWTNKSRRPHLVLPPRPIVVAEAAPTRNIFVTPDLVSDIRPQSEGVPLHVLVPPMSSTNVSSSSIAVASQ